VSYEILFTEEHREQVVRYHGEKVADRLEERLEKKQKELELISEPNQLGRRFHNFFGYDGVKIAEPSFKAHRNQYRGILILVENADALVFYKVIQKEERYESSEQFRTVQSIEKNPQKVMKYAKDVVLEEMDL